MRTVALRTITEKIGSGSTPRGGEDSYAGHGTPLIRSLNVYDDGFREEGLAFLTTQQANDLSSVTVESGDVLLNITGASVARCCLAPDRFLPARVNQHVCIIRPTKAVLDSRYLQHLLISGSMKRRLLRIGESGGATRQAITKADLQDLKIPLPALQDQKRIATILDAADALRAKRRESIEQLDLLRTAVFFDSFGKPGDGRWTEKTVGDCGRVQLGRQRAPQYQTGRHTRPYLRVANVFEDRIDVTDLKSMDFDAKDYAAYELQHEDILLNEGQSTELVGRPAMWRNEVPGCCFQNTLVRFQADRSVVMPAFALHVFLYYLRAGEFAKVSTKTSSIAHLGAGRFAKMLMPVPPITLQQKFAAIVESIEQQMARLKAHLAELDALFASLQSRAFSGELCSSSFSRQHASA
jgi:type I restriction enzyme S subunit